MSLPSWNLHFSESVRDINCNYTKSSLSKKCYDKQRKKQQQQKTVSGMEKDRLAGEELTGLVTFGKRFEWYIYSTREEYFRQEV